MSKVKCVNTSHPDFIKLQSESGINRFELELAVSDWQTSNDTDVFPTIDEIQAFQNTFYQLEPDNTKTDLEVREKILEALNKNGISVMSMEQYVQDYELRTGKAVALADTARKIIAVDEATEGLLTMPEEAMHMTVASQVGTFEFNRAMRLVEQAPEYTEHADTYRKVYAASGLTGEVLEKKVKMEILGKVGAQSLFSNIKDNVQGTGVMKYLRKMWNKFMSMFRKAKPELIRILDRWSESFIDGNLGVISSEGTFYELEDDAIIADGEKLYKKSMEKLLNRYKFMKRIDRSREYLRDRYYELRKLEYTEGIFKFMKYAKEDMNTALAVMDDIKSKKVIATSNNYRDLKLLIGYYESELRTLEKYFDPMLRDDGVFDKEQIKKANKTLGKLVKKKHKLESFKLQLGRNLALERVQGGAKEAISDPKLLAEELARLEKDIDAVDYDSNKLQYWFGSLVHARDSFQRWMHYAVAKVKRSVDRYTYDLGKELVQLGTKLGVIDTSKFIEKDAEGKFMHYFIDFFRTGAFMSTQKKFHQEMHKEYGLPEDVYERGLVKQAWYDAVEAVNEGTATDEQIELAKTLQEYNTKIAIWFEKNTVPVDNWQAIIEQRKLELGGGTSDAFKEWKRMNVGIAKRGTLWEYEYPKGELATPSDGRVKTKTFGGKTKSVTTIDWRNPEYTKLSTNEIEMLNKLISVMEQAEVKLPKKREHRLQLPQVKASTVDLLKRGKFKGIVEQIKDIARVAEDDTQFGDAYRVERPDGTLAEFVPIYFMNKLERADEISPDLVSSVLAFANVMENYRQMSSNVSTFEMVLDTIGHRTVDTGKRKMTGVESEVYKSMEKFIEMNVYGKMKESWIVGGINMTKLMQKLTKYVTANNLAFNLYTTMASYFTSATYSKIEDLVGQYTTVKDKLKAEKIWDTNIHQVLIEAGKVDKTSKLGLFFEEHRILKNNQNIFSNLDKSRLTRKALESGLFWSYELVKLRIRGKLALAIASNYKSYNGDFYNRKELENMGVKDIDNLKSYWDHVTVRDGKLVTPPSKRGIADIIERRTEYIGQNIDGELGYTDWAAAHQGALMQLVTTHRGWLFRNAQLRLKSKGVNYQTGEIEEGFYMTFFDFARRTFFSKERVTTLKGLLAAWETLEAHEKQGVLRTLWEMAFIQAAMTLALMLNNLAGDDDDDDSLIQYMAYQSNRVLLELGAMNPSLFIAFDPLTGETVVRPPLLANIQELTAILNSPVAATRQVNDLLEITNLFSSEEIKSGPYEGMSKFQRLAIKMGPGTKGIYQSRDPKSRNVMLRNKTLNWMYH